MNRRRTLRKLYWVASGSILAVTVVIWVNLFAGDKERERFESYANMLLPSGAKILAMEDSHGGFFGEGEFYMVFDMTEAETRRMSERVPWKDCQLKNGPVPEDISIHCRFGSSWNIKPKYGIAPPWKSMDILYVAQPQGPAGMPWHNGRIFIVSLPQSRAWFCQWDF